MKEIKIIYIKICLLQKRKNFGSKMFVEKHFLLQKKNYLLSLHGKRQIMSDIMCLPTHGGYGFHHPSFGITTIYLW